MTGSYGNWGCCVSWPPKGGGGAYLVPIDSVLQGCDLDIISVAVLATSG